MHVQHISLMHAMYGESELASNATVIANLTTLYTVSPLLLQSWFKNCHKISIIRDL